MPEILNFSAIEMRRRIGSRDLSPVELVDACIAQIETLNPRINAVVTENFEAARQEAKSAVDKLATDETLPLLHGIPVLVKDLSATRGLRTTYGSQCFANYVPDYDSLIVERLKKAGAIVLGKTNTPEFGAGANTSNLVFGATGNPYNPSVTSGGSSGGSAAALACNMAPLATGSDLGGSLRIPASFCGIVGMRPSPGLVPSHTHVCGFSPLWTDGPMARSVEDLALMLSAIAGFDARDPLSMPHSSFDMNAVHDLTDLSRFKIGYSTTLGVADVDRQVAALFEARKSTISTHFHSAEDLKLDLSSAAEIFRVLRAESLYASYGELAHSRAGELSENVRANILEATTLSLRETARANAGHTEIYRAFQRIFDDIDFLICPATAVSPFPVGENHPTEINGAPLKGYYAWYAITWALSLTGSPVVTIPCGLDHKNMPFGIQIVGPRHSDQQLLSFARALEFALNIDGIGRPAIPTHSSA